MELLKENFIFGVGNNLESFNSICSKIYTKGFIAHNVILREFVMNGLVGFISCVALIMLLINIISKTKDRLLVIITLNTIIICMIEDFLHVQRGVLLFIPLFCFLLFASESKKIL